MASESLSEQIVDAITARLSALTAGATYWFTPSEVTRTWKIPPEAPKLARDRPSYAVIAGEEASPPGTYTFDRTMLPIKLIVWVEEPGDRQQALNRAIADIRVAIGSDITWSGLAMDTEITAVRRDDAPVSGQPFAYAVMELNVMYMHVRTAA